MPRSNSQFLGPQFWAEGGEATPNLTTSGSEAKDEFNYTLGQPGAPTLSLMSLLPPVPAPSALAGLATSEKTKVFKLKTRRGRLSKFQLPSSYGLGFMIL